MPKILPKKSCLLGLEMLTLSLDHNHEALATLISCLLNSCPNLKNLKIIVSPKQLMFIQFFFCQQLLLKCFSVVLFERVLLMMIVGRVPRP